jgi:DNA-binding transcriptional MerR regulator
MERKNKVYKINTIAKELAVSIQTIKNYEALGLLPKPRKDAKGWRFYTLEDLIKIKSLYKNELASQKGHPKNC